MSEEEWLKYLSSEIVWGLVLAALEVYESSAYDGALRYVLLIQFEVSDNNGRTIV